MGMAHLIRGVTDANVKVGQFGLDEIPNDQLELPLFRPSRPRSASSVEVV